MSDVLSSYRRRRRARFATLAAIAAVTFVLALTDITVGSSSLTLKDVFEALIQGPDGESGAAFILWEIRLPMTLTCLFVGASLSLAGLLIQTITNNPLASPYTLGVTAGASFGAAIAITLGVSVLGQLWIGTASLALIFALSVSLLIYYLGRKQGMSASTVVLIGIIMNFFFQALQQYLQYRASPEIAQIIAGWTFGNLQRASWVSTAVASACWAGCIALVAPKVWQLTALSAGEDRAESLGIKVSSLRLFIFAVSSLLIASSVGFIGTVAFVGLIAPHCAKILLGEDHRLLLIGSSLTGCSLMLAASTVAKLLSEGAALPVGIVTSIVGVPFLFLLLMRSRRMAC